MEITAKADFFYKNIATIFKYAYDTQKRQSMLQKVKMVIFDFDGTLSASDSNLEFGRYCFRHSIRPWIFLPIFLIGLGLYFLNKHSKLSRELMRCFVTRKMVRDFAPIVVAKHRQKRFGWAAAQVAKEKSAGNLCILISAGPDYLVPDLVSDMEFDAILTSKMEINKPWKYKFMCWGPNKVTALEIFARRHNFVPQVVRAYGDSKSDKYIMDMANTQVWINRKTGLPK